MIQRLDDGLRRRLTIVTAPAGFGKTTLLADWAGRENRHVAWLSLDAGDDSPKRFWLYVIGALQSVQPGIGAASSAAINRGESPDIALTYLLNEIASISGTISLVLDDYNSITHPGIHSTLGFFLERIPQQAHLYVTSTSAPPLQLARLRARGDLLEIRAPELRFTPHEATTVVRSTAGPSAISDEVDEIVAMCEGWAVGLKLAALSLGETLWPATGRKQLKDRYPYVAEYIVSEVLERLGEDARALLGGVAITESFNLDLCGVLNGEKACSGLLADLAATEFFIEQDEQRPGWYRLHPLFGAIVRETVEQQPEAAIELHRRAAEWFQEHDMAHHAVQHLVAAGLRDEALRLAERTAESQLASRSLGHLLAWQRSFPAESLATRPRLALAMAWALLLDGKPELSRQYVNVARRSAPPPASDGLADINGHLGALESALEQLSPAAEEPVVRAASTPDVSDLQAEKAAAARQDAEFSAHRFSVPEALPAIGWLQLRQGKLSAALSTFNDALDMIASQPGSADESATLASCNVGLAAIEYERDHIDEAMRRLSEGLTQGRAAADTSLLRDGYLLLAQVHQARGDLDGALDAINGAESALRRAQPTEHDRAVLEAFRARIQLARGAVDEAASWARAEGARGAWQDAGDDAHAVTFARILLSERKAADALEFIAPLVRRSEEEGHNDIMIKALLVQALALEQQGESEQAAQAAQRALLLGEPEGYVRSIVSEGEPMIRLLKKLRAMQENGEIGGSALVSTEYIRGLLASLGVAPNAAGRMSADAGLAGSLLAPVSDREIEVLRLIGDGKSNAAIAETLYISVSTVKTHINNLYSKLGVESRTQALARAREFNLL